MMRWLGGLIFLFLIAAGAAYYVAGRGASPVITIEDPQKVIGQTGNVAVTIETPGGRVSSVRIALEQNGQATTLLGLEGQTVLKAQAASETQGESGAITQTGPDTIRFARPLGKQSLPTIQQGAARIT